MPREPAPGPGRGTPRHEPYALCPRHLEGRAHQGVQQRRHDPRLHLHRRHRRGQRACARPHACRGKVPERRSVQSIQHRLLGADAAGRRFPDERRHHETRGGMRLQAPLEPARRHRRVHEVVQERQESVEVGLLLDAGHKMPAGSLTRPREIFFKKSGGGY